MRGTSLSRSVLPSATITATTTLWAALAQANSAITFMAVLAQQKEEKPLFSVICWTSFYSSHSLLIVQNPPRRARQCCSIRELDEGLHHHYTSPNPSENPRSLILHLPSYLLSESAAKIYLGIAGWSSTVEYQHLRISFLAWPTDIWQSF